MGDDATSKASPERMPRGGTQPAGEAAQRDARQPDRLLAMLLLAGLLLPQQSGAAGPPAGRLRLETLLHGLLGFSPRPYAAGNFGLEAGLEVEPRAGSIVALWVGGGAEVRPLLGNSSMLEWAAGGTGGVAVRVAQTSPQARWMMDWGGGIQYHRGPWWGGLAIEAFIWRNHFEFGAGAVRLLVRAPEVRGGLALAQTANEDGILDAGHVSRAYGRVGIGVGISIGAPSARRRQRQEVTGAE